MFDNISKVFKPPYRLHDLPALLGIFLLFLIIPVVTLNIGKVNPNPTRAATLACSSLGDYGNVDGNTVIDQRDVDRTLQIAVGQTATRDEKLRADVNGDREVNSIDAQLISLYINNSPLQYTFKSCVDSDGDQFSNPRESYLGTSHLNACGTNSWPPDMNNDQRVNIQDVTAYSGNINKPASTKELKRLDLDGDGVVTQTYDLEVEFRKFLHQTCDIVRYPQFLPTSTTLRGNNSSNPTIQSGGSVTFTWNSGGYFGPCTGGDSWSNSVFNSTGSYTINNIPQSYNGKKYTIVCYGYGQESKASVTLNVTAPASQCSGDPHINSINPNPASPGSTVTLSANGLSNCTSSDRIFFAVWNWATKRYDWKPSCALTNGSSCSTTFTAPSREDKYPILAWRDNNGDGKGEQYALTSSGAAEYVDLVVRVPVSTPPPPPSGINPPYSQRPMDCSIYYSTYFSSTHKAVDLLCSNRATFNTPVRSVSTGTVIFNGTYGLGGYSCGYEVKVRTYTSTGTKYVFRYCHLNGNISLPSQINAGTLIGYADNSGYSFGSHLHLCVEVNGPETCRAQESGTQIDPRSVISGIP